MLAVVLLLVALIGFWFWTIQRNYEFVMAANAGNINKVRAGLDSGIDPNITCIKGLKALPCAINARYPASGAIVRLLLDRGADPNDGLFMAVSTGQPEIVQLLIAKGANVNPKDFSWCGFNSLLLVAAQAGNNKVIQLLKAAGARK